MGMSILYIGNHLSSSKNNPTTSFTLIKGLNSLGHNIITASHIESKGLRLLHMIWSFFRNFNKYELIIVDVYSTQNFWYAVIIALLAKIFSKPYITILHGGDLVNRISSTGKISLFLLKNARVNISPSTYLHNFILEMGFSNIRYIPNPIFIQNYPYKLREQLQPSLLWVRAFDEIYNPKLALEVLELILKDFPEAKLCMVGPSKDKSIAECKLYAKQKGLPVNFKGKMKKNNWIALAKEFDVFLNTSNIDNMPVSVLEAMALGLPVVSTEVGGIPYMIKNKVNGILVPPDDPGQMSMAVKQLLLNFELSKSLVENARSMAVKCDWSSIKDDWIEVLR
jgi:glycosyltransferase involved in cell wall biosynthesis